MSFSQYCMHSSHLYVNRRDVVRWWTTTLQRIFSILPYERFWVKQNSVDRLLLPTGFVLISVQRFVGWNVSLCSSCRCSNMFAFPDNVSDLFNASLLVMALILWMLAGFDANMEHMQWFRKLLSGLNSNFADFKISSICGKCVAFLQCSTDAMGIHL